MASPISQRISPFAQYQENDSPSDASQASASTVAAITEKPWTPDEMRQNIIAWLNAALREMGSKINDVPAYHDDPHAGKTYNERFVLAANLIGRGHLENTTNLYLSYLSLPSLPRGIGQLTNLRSLRLSNNQLTRLPREFGQLKNLQMLLIGENQLITLPPELTNLKNLSMVFLGGSTFKDMPTALEKPSLYPFLGGSTFKAMPTALEKPSVHPTISTCAKITNNFVRSKIKHYRPHLSEERINNEGIDKIAEYIQDGAMKPLQAFCFVVTIVLGRNSDQPTPVTHLENA